MLLRRFVASSAAPAAFNPKLLELIACPLTKTRLRYDSAKNELVSDAAKLAFSIDANGVPNLHVSDARKLE